MVTLDSQALFGKGANRECYLHPEENDKCIKIRFSKNDQKDKLEQYYYARLSKRKISWEMLSRSYGTVKTDRGTGYVFELIRDYDGNISKTLQYHLSREGSAEISVEAVCQTLTRIKQYLLNEKIILTNIKTYNLVYKKISPDEGLLIIIDNIGYHNAYFHLCEYVEWFAIYRIRKKWKNFLTDLARDYKHHEKFYQAIVHMSCNP
jgi:hypothetical protein